MLDPFQKSTLPKGSTVKNSSPLIHSVQQPDWKIHQWLTQKNETLQLREKGKGLKNELSLRAAWHNRYVRYFSFAQVAGVIVVNEKKKVFSGIRGERERESTEGLHTQVNEIVAIIPFSMSKFSREKKDRCFSNAFLCVQQWRSCCFNNSRSMYLHFVNALHLHKKVY